MTPPKPSPPFKFGATFRDDPDAQRAAEVWTELSAQNPHMSHEELRNLVENMPKCAGLAAETAAPKEKKA